MTKSDPHQQRIIVDTAEWWDRLERLAEMRDAADRAPIATERPAEALVWPDPGGGSALAN